MLAIGVVHQKVDPVLEQGIGRGGLGFFLFLFIVFEKLEVAAQARFHVVQVFDGLGIGEFAADDVDDGLDDGSDGFGVPGLETVAGFLLDLPELLEDGFQLLGQDLVFLLQGLQVGGRKLLLLDQGLELGKRRRLVLDDGNEIGFDEEAHLDLNDREALLGRLLLEGLQKGFLLGLLLFDDGVPALGVVGAFEQVRDVVLQHLQEVVHSRHEQSALAGRERQQGRLNLDDFVTETIAVDGVEDAFEKMQRGEVALFPALQELFDRRRPAGAGHAGDEDVVAQAVDVQAGLEGLERPVLADDLLAGRTEVARLIGQRFGVAPPAQLFQGNFGNGGFRGHEIGSFTEFQGTMLI